MAFPRHTPDKCMNGKTWRTGRAFSCGPSECSLSNRKCTVCSGIGRTAPDHHKAEPQYDEQLPIRVLLFGPIRLLGNTTGIGTPTSAGEFSDDRKGIETLVTVMGIGAEVSSLPCSTSNEKWQPLHPSRTPVKCAHQGLRSGSKVKASWLAGKSCSSKALTAISTGPFPVTNHAHRRRVLGTPDQCSFMAARAIGQASEA